MLIAEWRSKKKNFNSTQLVFISDTTLNYTTKINKIHYRSDLASKQKLCINGLSNKNLEKKSPFSDYGD